MIRRFLSPSLVAVLALVLSSCHFNSAGIARERASHKQMAFLSDILPGHTIYAEGKNYYVELPCYKVGRPARLLNRMGTQYQDARFALYPLEDKVLLNIPADYAEYIVGWRSSPKPTPPRIKRVKEGARELKKRCQTHLAVKTPKDVRYEFTRKSSSAGFWKSLAAVESCTIDPVGSLVASCVYVGTLGFLVYSSTETGGNEAADEATKKMLEYAPHAE